MQITVSKLSQFNDISELVRQCVEEVWTTIYRRLDFTFSQIRFCKKTYIRLDVNLLLSVERSTTSPMSKCIHVYYSGMILILGPYRLYQIHAVLSTQKNPRSFCLLIVTLSSLLLVRFEISY